MFCGPFLKTLPWATCLTSKVPRRICWFAGAAREREADATRAAEVRKYCIVNERLKNERMDMLEQARPLAAVWTNEGNEETEELTKPLSALLSVSYVSLGLRGDSARRTSSRDDRRVGNQRGCHSCRPDGSPHGGHCSIGAPDCPFGALTLNRVRVRSCKRSPLEATSAGRKPGLPFVYLQVVE